MVEDLDRRPLEPWRDPVRDLPEQHDVRHGDVVGRDAAEPRQQLVGADELSAFQPPGKGDKQLGCLVLGRGEEVMRHWHALSLLAWSRCPAGSPHPTPRVRGLRRSTVVSPAGRLRDQVFATILDRVRLRDQPMAPQPNRARLRSRSCDRTDWSGGVGPQLALPLDTFRLVGSPRS